jgi:hypothetical protein
MLISRDLQLTRLPETCVVLEFVLELCRVRG